MNCFFFYCFYLPQARVREAARSALGWQAPSTPKKGIRDWGCTCGIILPTHTRFKDHLNEAHCEELVIPTSAICDIATEKGFSICVKCGKALKATAAGGTRCRPNSSRWNTPPQVQGRGRGAGPTTPKPYALLMETTPKPKERPLLAPPAPLDRSQNDLKRSRSLSEANCICGMPPNGTATRSGRTVIAARRRIVFDPSDDDDVSGTQEPPPPNGSCVPPSSSPSGNRAY